MREDWSEIEYKNIVLKISTAKQKLKQKEYLVTGEFPVVDQGQELIGGYTNDSDRILNCNLPVIVFGDHTKCIKLINFKFAPGADGTKVLQPKYNVEPKYISYLTQVLVHKIKDKGYARHYQHIEKELLPLSPLAEQRAIVAKIEQLFSELDNGIANLKKAQEQLKIYRQAVLKKAFEGELTSEWRAQQTDLPTADKLLEQIKEERENQNQQQLEEWNEAVKSWETNGKEGKKQGKPQKHKEPLPLDPDEIILLGSVPNLWDIGRLEYISMNITDGDHQAPPKAKQGIPFITISNIKENKIDFTDTYFVDEDYYNSLINYRKPKYGDLLYTVTGSFGIPVIVDFNKEFCFQRHIGLIRPGKLTDSKWLFWLLQTKLVFHQALQKATGTAQKTVGLASLRSFVVPICSVKEQHQIVQEIETRLSVCDKLEEDIQENLKKSEALRQSILKQAFEGKLLNQAELEACRQEPDWEPAEKLLERIKNNKD